MRCEYDVIVELLAYHPCRKNRVFQVLAYLNVPQGLEDSQETELGLLSNAFQPIVI